MFGIKFIKVQPTTYLLQQERAIKENELNTEIAVENKKRQIRETQMEAERAVQEKKHLVKEALEANIGLEHRRKSLVALASENAKAEADARAYGVSSTMKALGTADARILQALASTGMKPEQLIAFAFQSLPVKLTKSANSTSRRTCCASYSPRKRTENESTHGK